MYLDCMISTVTTATLIVSPFFFNPALLMHWQCIPDILQLVWERIVENALKNPPRPHNLILLPL
jgi:hypothetical protein